jgi:aspartokinase/homoserine dehydrogenase 1
MPGFISSSSESTPTPAVSDYTAAIMAGALDATDLEIWTDVNGMYTANPKIVTSPAYCIYILSGSDGVISF